MPTARKTSTRKTTIRSRPVRTQANARRGVKRTPAAVTRNSAPSPNGKHGKVRAAKSLPSQKEALLQERANVENELTRLRQELQQAPEMTGDEVDLNVYEREKTLGLVATFERRLEEIEATLKVAAQGKYGICERCGSTIDPERLKIFPETRLCVSCKNEIEKEQRRLRL
jgi:RNA polymerase-binding protein DksA